MKNDVSILLDGNIPLWEQQGSINPNMPVRGFMYFGSLYSQYVKVNKLKLSDSFMNKTDNGEFEWTATVYNLNRGKNDALLLKCKPLSEYMELINRIRDNQNYGMNIQNAINTAVNSCIADNIMKDFLTKHKAEVMSVCITEFDEKVFTDGIREEGREEGLAEGLSRGRQDGLKALIHSLRDFLPDFESVYQAVIRNTEYANISREQVQKYY